MKRLNVYVFYASDILYICSHCGTGFRQRGMGQCELPLCATTKCLLDVLLCHHQIKTFHTSLQLHHHGTVYAGEKLAMYVPLICMYKYEYIHKLGGTSMLLSRGKVCVCVTARHSSGRMGIISYTMLFLSGFDSVFCAICFVLFCFQ